MFRLAFAAALIVTPSLASARPDTTPQRIRSVQLTKGQTCPKASSPDEVVVCSTLEEPYRIPSPLRESAPSAANQSWVNRAATIDDVGRVAGGLPDTCSAVGTGGQSGCFQQQAKQFAADKRARARGQSTDGQ